VPCQDDGEEEEEGGVFLLAPRMYLCRLYYCLLSVAKQTTKHDVLSGNWLSLLEEESLEMPL